MINKKPTRKYAMLKTLLLLPVIAGLAYAFATPEYHYSGVLPEDKTLSIYQAPVIIQQEVKGLVSNESGKPLQGVMITSTGIVGEAFGAETGADGRFIFRNLKADASLLFDYKGYKRLTLKPVFGSEMKVTMVLDPDYKAPFQERPEPLVVVDGVISDKNVKEAGKELGYNRGISKFLMGKEATDKYGEKGANGVYELTTRKKALEMGLKPPFPRLAPDDFPTFQKKPANGFTDWLVSNIKYPAEAETKKLEGWVSLNFTVGLDGNISNIVSTISVDRILSDEVIKAVLSAPKWDPPKNPNVDEPYNSSVTLKFQLPDQVSGKNLYVVVEKMPVYPGGEVELMKFIRDNLQYPEEAKAEKIEGRVILRFIVNSEGNVEGISVLRGVHPLLDAEAKRVISLMPSWKPATQDGKAVNVWYSVPVPFSLSSPKPVFTQTSMADLYRFLNANIIYPQEAKIASDTGRVFVVVKLSKGGIVKDCKAFTERSDIKVPVLDEVVIVGYKPGSEKSSPKELQPGKSEHLVLKTECLRIANLLTTNEIPDWKDKDLEFALAFKFLLK